MIRIRFDGRSVDRFLSARHTGLPWFDFDPTTSGGVRASRLIAVTQTEVRSVANLPRPLAFNLPYVLIPLLLLIRMRKPQPFTRKF